MSNAAKLKKRAVELEQKKQFDKALTIYIQFLQESEGALDDLDIPLYNRVGDLLLRTGNASDALNYYEQAVDLYADRGFHNNAIALCNKVLRQSPGRASIYYKLGKISATKGFKSDAKKNFLEYADRMQKAGKIDEAFRALKEFADLCPDQDDIRLMLAEQLTKENRQDEALEQLHKLHDRLNSEGRTAEARATAERMKIIDPDTVPRASGAYRPQKSTDLIFLDTSYEQATRQREPSPASVPQPAPGRQVSDPDLVLLTLSDHPDASVSPTQTPVAGDSFGLDLDAPNDASATAALPMLDVGDELPSADELTASIEIGEPEATGSHAIPPQPSAITPLDFDIADTEAVSAAVTESAEPAVIDREPTPIEVDIEPSSYVPGPTLGVDYVSDLAGDLTASLDADNSLFDFRAPPRSDGQVTAAPTPVNLDPDVAFPSFDLDDTSLPSADEVTSGASLTAALGTDETLGIGLDEFDATVGEDSAAHSVESDAEPVLESSAASPAPAGDLDLEWPATAATEASPSEASASALAMSIDDMIVADTDDQPARTPASSRDAISAVTPIDTASHVASDVEIEIPSDDLVDDVAAAPAVGADADLTSSVTPTGEMDVVAPSAQTPPSTFAQKAPERGSEVTTPATTASVGADETVDRDAGWETQRAHAERLLEAGDRAGGVATLEQVAVELERLGDLERALTIVDELIRLSPDSIRHHQKRVELAFRSSDRVKLIDAYLELGDALFRSGEERKARAVYQRVHELAPDDPRARAAIESVASMSPPAGSGAIQAIPAPPADVRQPAAPPRSRDMQAPQAPASGNGAQRGSGITAPQSRKPSPLDRAAAANGEFVDLGEWLRSGENPKSTRMVAEEKPPTGDEQADFAEMLKRFKQGVAENVDEEDFESHYDLGVAYKEMGLMDEAVAEFQKALRGTTNRVRSYEALGQCFVEKEQFQVAASVLTRAIALGEGDDHHLVGVLYMLGRATEALGRERDALDYYQRVFAVDIEFRDVADRIHAIERKAT